LDTYNECGNDGEDRHKEQGIPLHSLSVKLAGFFVVRVLFAFRTELFQHEFFYRVDFVARRHVVLAFADSADERE
jgi:hypothetical protein